MTPEAEQLIVDGPYVDATVRNLTTGESAQVRLLVDTGADQSVVDADLLSHLQAPVRGTTWVAGVTSPEPIEANVCAIEVQLPMRRFLVDVIAMPRDAVGNDGLIGRDVLAHLTFTYDGPAGSFELR
jgi:predicted aspartyl protease